MLSAQQSEQRASMQPSGLLLMQQPMQRSAQPSVHLSVPASLLRVPRSVQPSALSVQVL
jgi:hypothetical protein